MKPNESKNKRSLEKVATFKKASQSKRTLEKKVRRKDEFFKESKGKDYFTRV